MKLSFGRDRKLSFDRETMVQTTISLTKLVVLVSIAIVLVGAEENPTNRVVGGEDGDIGEFPHQVSLRINFRHMCGGTIIGKRHILTAAHCVPETIGLPVYDFFVITGSNSVTPGSGVPRAIKNVTVHPEYSSRIYESWRNDVAVITLWRDIKFDATTRSITISERPIASNLTCTASGWGDMYFPIVQKPNNLRKAEMTTITNEECASQYSDVEILDSHVCALASPGTGLCFGDSGGPLCYDGEIIGVAAFVIPCARGVPDVFTRISLYIDFIKDVMART